MRQATPFAGVLSPSERSAIYDLFKSSGSTLLAAAPGPRQEKS
jgi:hypothetical protein